MGPPAIGKHIFHEAKPSIIKQVGHVQVQPGCVLPLSSATQASWEECTATQKPQTIPSKIKGFVVVNFFAYTGGNLIPTLVPKILGYVVRVRACSFVFWEYPTMFDGEVVLPMWFASWNYEFTGCCRRFLNQTGWCGITEAATPMEFVLGSSSMVPVKNSNHRIILFHQGTHFYWIT